MAQIGDRVLDNGLTVLDTEANALHICSQEPTTYTEATSTYTLGNKTTYSSGAPADRGGGGREVTFPSISDGSVTGTNTATHFAVVDTVNSRLLAVQALSSSQAVTSGNTFTLTSFTVGIPDPA
jgi:hypothetical protein